MEIQCVGADLGRGFVKSYTEVGKESTSYSFRSIVGDGRSLDYSRFDRPIHLEVGEEEFFVGELAEKESYNQVPNYSDDKTTDVAKKLLLALLSQLVESEYVKICLGVPNKTFSKTTLNAVKNEYSGKTFTITDKVANQQKKITIADISIARESDAALYYIISRSEMEKKILAKKKLGMVTVGFRTTELTYFDTGFVFNDRLSKTLEIGNRTILEIIQKQLEREGIIKTLHEIDNDNKYMGLKQKFYTQLVERINQQIEMNWINYKEMEIFLGGGTTLNFAKVPNKFRVVPDAQMLTARGLHYIATNKE